jgi:glycosyltransferase involved in cell wall biosynthesis
MLKIYSHVTYSSSEKKIQKANYINTINTLKGFCLTGNKIYTCKGENFERFIKLFELNKYNINYINSSDDDIIVKYILKNKIDIVYCRTFKIPIQLAMKNYNGKIFMEAHADYPPDIIKDNMKDKIIYVTISDILKKNWGFQNSLVFPCCVNYDIFSKCPENLFKFNYEFNITYTGHIYPYKGIPILIEAAKLLPNIGFHIIGGNDEEKSIYENYPINVIFYGHKGQNELPRFTYSSDILLLPYTNNHFQSTTTSPIKLFEYLITGKIVLASDIEGIKNWGKEFVYYYNADNLKSLVQNINIIKNNYNHYNSEELIEKRTNYAKQFTFVEKANKMINFKIK